jgi:opacity protein-like surface antigen
MQSCDMKRSFLAGAALLAAGAAQAADVRPFVKAGADFGGDKLVTVVFVDGERESIKANEGFYFGGGVSIRNEAKTLESDLSIAYKLSGITASNGDIDWTMMPVEALLFYRLPQWRLGGGVAYHMNPRLKGSGVVGGLDVKFDDALGLVLQADYLIGQSMAVGARYTSVKYEEKGGTGISAKSGGIGATFSYRF